MTIVIKHKCIQGYFVIILHSVALLSLRQLLSVCALYSVVKNNPTKHTLSS